MSDEASTGQSRLIETVLEPGLCIRCGACVGLCPYLDDHEGRVVVMDRCCSDTWRCLQLCPRAGYAGTDPEGAASARPLGTYQEICVARATEPAVQERAQYGGVVSVLLIHALEQGRLRAAVLTDAGGAGAPAGTLARDREAVLAAAGSRYCGAASLASLNRAIRAGETRMGVVGLPCQMEALARMARMIPDGPERAEHVVLKIGLFCTWAVDYRDLARFLKRRGLAPGADKFDIPPPPAETFDVRREGTWHSVPLDQVRAFIQPGCRCCGDMTSRLADLSVGTVEGRPGWNTVIVRTRAGAEALQETVRAGRIEKAALPADQLEHLSWAAGNKEARARQRMQGSGS